MGLKHSRRDSLAIVPLTTDDFQSVFSQIEWAFDHFEERSRGEAEKGQLIADIMSDRRQVWLVVSDKVKAVALTEVLGGKIVVLTHCTGENHTEWASDLVDTVQDWAKHIGAATIRAVCRPGWSKFLKNKGMKETHRVLETQIG